MKLTPREGSIVDTIMRRAKTYAPALVICKRHGGGFGHNGDADIYGCLNGRHVEVEVKQPGQKPTKLQAERLKVWEAAGAITGWVTSADEFFSLLFDHHQNGKGEAGGK